MHVQAHVDAHAEVERRDDGVRVDVVFAFDLLHVTAVAFVGERGDVERFEAFRLLRRGTYRQDGGGRQPRRSGTQTRRRCRRRIRR